MTILHQYILCNLIFVTVFNFSTATWWSVGYNDPIDSYKRLCRGMQKLRGSQRILCRKETKFTEEIMRGFGRAMKECGKQFKFQRWNCSIDRRSLKRTLNQDSRETAVLNAFASAGITHAIAESCSKGKLTNCGCEQATIQTGYYENIRNATDIRNNPEIEEEEDQKWRWRGCSEYFRFASHVSKKLTDGRRERVQLRRDVRSIVTLHNNNVGRKVIKSLLQRNCKCHGLSGSCNLKTCSFKLPSMSRVGEALLQKYLQAVQVISTNDGRDLIHKESWQKLRKDDLVFLEASPNYCKRNLRKGSLGTKGRECNRTHAENCDLLCCGRGYSTSIEEVEENCNCVFTFCCEVRCQKCRKSRMKSFCK